MPDDRTPFVKLAFAGNRFNGARLPADASVNLSIYQRLLVELAKQIWRDRNPNRLRLPRNFDRYFQLEIGAIEDGSAVANLPRFEEDLPPLFGSMPPGDIFDRAQEKLIEIIDAANDNKPLPRLSTNVRNELRALRKNLRPNEQIIVTRGRLSREYDRHPVTVATRERIIQEIREERLVNVSGFGILSGVSEAPPAIFVVSENGLLKFDLNFQTARVVYNGQNGRLVDFNIQAIVDYDGLVKDIRAVNAVHLLEDNISMARAVARVEALSGLEASWHEGVGREIPQLTIITARDIARFISSFEESIGIFPTIDGEVSIEYTRNDLEWTVMVKDLHIVVEVLSLDTDESVTQRFKGTSRGLLQTLLSKNGVVHE